VIWTSEITHAGYVPEVFDYKEVVSWCVEKFIPGQIIIPLHDHSPISLAPQLFHEMLKFLKPTLTIKGQDCKKFLEEHHNGLDIIANFLKDSTIVPEDITMLQVNSFRNPFRKSAWLFTRITGQASTTSISHIIIYILYFIVKEKYIFDWGKLISIELYSQLSRFKE
jgi:hypothetical protein